MKKSVTNNYILVDFGNTCIKACIYNKQANKISHCLIESNKVSFSQIVNKMQTKKIDKVIYVSSSCMKLQNKVLTQIKQYCKNIQIVDRKILTKFINLSNIDKKVVIGNDILLFAYYLIKQYDKAAILALGTVYYLLVTNKNKIESVHLIPNLAAGLKTIANKTSIPNNLIPEIFNKDIGLNTPDAFASGIKTIMDGYLELISKRFNISKKRILVSGGDAYRFASLNKKYNFISYASLKALALLTKEKKW